MGTGIGPQNLGEPGGKEGHTACGHKKPETQVIGVEISPLTKPSDEELAKLRKEPGKSNAFRYDPDIEYAGADDTFPINTEERGKSAIKLAHNAADPSAIKAKVYKKYPNLKPEIGVQAPNNSRTA